MTPDQREWSRTKEELVDSVTFLGFPKELGDAMAKNNHISVYNMRIGILSDTHGLLRDDVMKALEGVDHIIHAGDIDRKEVIDSLESIAPVTVVRGNADKDWAEHIPVTASIYLAGKRFFIIHNKGKIEYDLSGYDVIVYGHSHHLSRKI